MVLLALLAYRASDFNTSNASNWHLHIWKAPRTFLRKGERKKYKETARCVHTSRMLLVTLKRMELLTLYGPVQDIRTSLTAFLIYFAVLHRLPSH